MRTEIVDLTFGINDQARAVLHMLSDRSPDFAEYENGFYKVWTQTRPWYNGREKGFVVSMQNMSKNSCSKAINIAVFEYRSADNLCVLSWTDQFMYSPEIDFQGTLDKAYKSESSEPDASFDHGEIGKCADWIYEKLADHYRLTKK